MKLIFIKLFVLGMRVLYAPMKLRKTKNKILYCSRQSNTPSKDMLALKREIEKIAPHTRQVFRLRYLRDEKGLSLSYLFGILGDMWEMASARIVIADTYSIPLSCLHHKKQQKRVQIWHALAAVKQFGLQAAGKAQGRDDKVARALCMHQNYTHVIAPSKATGEFYQKAFGCESSAIHIASLPRVDELLQGDSRKEEFLKQNPKYGGKRLILYVPTFREGDEEFCLRLAGEFEKHPRLGLVVAPHPISECAKNPAFEITGEFSTYDLMKLADELITDYSACSVEGALLSKPLRFFLPDYERYKREQGLNVELKQWFPNQCFEKEEDLVKAILRGEYPSEQVTAYAKEFVENQGTNNAEILANFICSL